MAEKLITFDNVTFSYEKNEAVKNVSFSVENGDYLCVLGENGTGKSTVVKLMLGLMKPSGGVITYDGISKTEIGYLPQTTSVDPGFPASVGEVVLQGRCNRLGRRFFYSVDDRRVADENMKLLGIDGIKNKNYTDLSGGQKQRVLLARALSATDKLLLLDEPVSGLDPIVTDEMYDIIYDLNKNKKISVVMISHDTKTVAKYAKHILHLKKEVLFFGTTEEYETTELFHEFLGGCGHEHH